MIIGLLNFSKELKPFVQKLIIDLYPEKVYIGRRDNIIEDFCYWHKISLTVLGNRVLKCLNCEEVIDNSDFIIICGTETGSFFSYSIDYCKSKRKDYVVVYGS